METWGLFGKCVQLIKSGNSKSSRITLGIFGFVIKSKNYYSLEMKTENRTLVFVSLAPPTRIPVVPSSPQPPARHLWRRQVLQRQTTQTKNRSRNVLPNVSWCPAHVTRERAKKAPLHLCLMRQTSATPHFSQLSKPDQASLRSVSQCTPIKSHHYLWFCPSDMRPLLSANFWFSLQILSAIAFSDLTTKKCY